MQEKHPPPLRSQGKALALSFQIVYKPFTNGVGNLVYLNYNKEGRKKADAVEIFTDKPTVDL